MKTNKYISYLRTGLLILFTVLITLAAYMHIETGGSTAASIHALCPFGGLESLYQIFTAGSYISKIFTGTLVLFFITLVLAVLFRRSFCGIICPFGAIQEFFAKIGSLIFKKKLIMPPTIDHTLRYLKYVILIITVVFAWITAGLWMSPYDPWAAYSHLPEGISNVWAESPVGLILLIITVLGSILYDRFFCKYLCPMGALYAIVGKLSPFKVVRKEELCIGCGMCSKVCPVNIDVQSASKITSAECISCGLCVLDCPVEGALENKIGKRTIKPFVVIFLVIALFFGSIFAFQAAGMYQVAPKQLASGVTISYSEIKGYMTISDAAKATNTELDMFYVKLMIPETVPPETQMKEIVAIVPEYDFDGIKASLE